MITEFFLWLMASVWHLVTSLFPDPDPATSTVADGVQQGIGTVLAYAGAFGHWIPWWVVVPVLALVMGALIAGGGIKLVRIVASFLTLGGGSAA